MRRYEEYVHGNDTPKTLCAEIDELRAEISKMECCQNCGKCIFVDGEIKDCEANFDCRKYTQQSVYDRWEAKK